MLAPFQQRPVLFAGREALTISNDSNLPQPQCTDCFDIEQLDALKNVDIAVVSDLTETLAKTEAMQWLGVLKNKLAQHIILIVDTEKSADMGWQFADFLGLGFKLHQQTNQHQFFYYAIESYQIRKDWLNAKYWANPENFDKYRW